MTEPSRGIGIDPCPKCGSADLVKAYVTEGNLLSCTCRTCGHIWTVAAADTPEAP